MEGELQYIQRGLIDHSENGQSNHDMLVSITAEDTVKKYFWQEKDNI